MADPTRRSFLQVGTVASLAAVGGVIPFLAGSKTTPVVDTHLHCFAGTKDSRFPYHPRAPYRPEPAATPEHLLKCMEGAGVDAYGPDRMIYGGGFGADATSPVVSSGSRTGPLDDRSSGN